MPQALPLQCPSCKGPLAVTHLACDRCRLTLSGQFEGGCRYCRQTAEHRALFDAFVNARGVLSEMERVLGISYPTLRGRLDAMFEALGVLGKGKAAPDEVRDERLAVLAALERGEVSADEAAVRLRAVRGGS